MSALENENKENEIKTNHRHQPVCALVGLGRRVSYSCKLAMVLWKEEKKRVIFKFMPFACI